MPFHYIDVNGSIVLQKGKIHYFRLASRELTYETRLELIRQGRNYYMLADRRTGHTKTIYYMRSMLKTKMLVCLHIFILLLSTFAKLRKATVSFVMCVCPSAWNNLAPAGRIFMKFGI
jgi:hypothetical protein